VSVTTTELAIAAAALAGVSLVLFVLALRRLLSRQAEVTVTMLRRYDERLATFAQTLNDAIAGFQAPPALASPSLEDDPEPMLRTLELARERTQADGAIALVTGGTGTPIVATVGLSESETNHIARMGFPDYRGARAIEVAFAGDLPAPEGEQPVRGGLVLPLLEESDAQSLLGVLTREKGRHFSEEDVDALDGVVRVARSPVARALNLREPDVVPEIDLLTNLLDRQSFTAVLEREIVRARLAGHPLSLLVVDVDRLTSLNARLGLDGADGVGAPPGDLVHGHDERPAVRVAGSPYERRGEAGGSGLGPLDLRRHRLEECRASRQPVGDERRDRARLGGGRLDRREARWMQLGEREPELLGEPSELPRPLRLSGDRAAADDDGDDDQDDRRRQEDEEQVGHRRRRSARRVDVNSGGRAPRRRRAGPAPRG
jgi:hypothetical protein